MCDSLRHGRHGRAVRLDKHHIRSVVLAPDSGIGWTRSDEWVRIDVVSTMTLRGGLALPVALVLLLAGCRAPMPDRPLVEPAQGFESVALALERAIEQELRDKGLPALSVALVSGQRTVWAKGFGMADPDEKVPATAETVYRTGAISALLTDIGVMRLQEAGKVDLDTPISRYLPEFAPHNPFGKAITLRMLMAHRAGLAKETPVGHVFDETSPSLADAVASLNGTRLVYEPGSTTKYSNAGAAVAGLVIERVEGQPFATWMKANVLDVIGLQRSSFETERDLLPRFARASMWTYDGRAFAAPTFEVSARPALGLNSTVLDLAKVLTTLNARGRVESGARVVRSSTLDRMWEIQYPTSRQEGGYGIGFEVSQLGGHRRIGLGGSIYGFASEMALLPDSDLGIVVMSSLDGAGAVVAELADYGLQLLSAARDGRTLPGYAANDTVPVDVARGLVGRYEFARAAPTSEAEAYVRAREAPAPPEHVDLVRRGDRLVLDFGTWRDEVRQAGPQLKVSGRVAVGPSVVQVEADRLTVAGLPYQRVSAGAPRDIPASWRGLIGEYGWEHSTFYVFERGGRLWILTEWFHAYPLDTGLDDEFWLPHFGLYAGERVEFVRDATGRGLQVSVGGVVLQRRPRSGEAESFRITPQRPVEQVRIEAMAAAPPAEPGMAKEPQLVELAALEPTVKLDIRYATTNNFVGAAFYDQARAFLQKPAAEALLRAHRALEPMGYGLLVYDAYRPWHITKIFWEVTPVDRRQFVADPARGSRHNRGCAVDLTLYDRVTGQPVEMIGGYDEFSERSYPDYPGGTTLQRWRRELLRRVMEEQGFEVDQYEWWHFDYRDWQQYPILNVAFASFEDQARTPVK